MNQKNYPTSVLTACMLHIGRCSPVQSGPTRDARRMLKSLLDTQAEEIALTDDEEQTLVAGLDACAFS